MAANVLTTTTRQGGHHQRRPSFSASLLPPNSPPRVCLSLSPRLISRYKSRPFLFASWPTPPAQPRLSVLLDACLVSLALRLRPPRCCAAIRPTLLSRLRVPFASCFKADGKSNQTAAAPSRFDRRTSNRSFRFGKHRPATRTCGEQHYEYIDNKKGRDNSVRGFLGNLNSGEDSSQRPSVRLLPAS